MKCCRVLFVMAVLVLWNLSASAQYSSSNKKAVRHYEAAVNLIATDPAQALKSLDMALEQDPSFAEAMLTAGDLCMQQQLLERARGYYTRFVESGSRHRSWVEEARHSIRCIDFIIEAKANPVEFNPVNLGPNINTRDEEYFPALTVDGSSLVFTRRFPRNQQTIANTPEEEDFYVSTLDAEGSWGKAVRMAEPLNSHDNEGAQCISQDGRIMFFTACGRQDGAGRCDIYMCVRHGDRWGKPRNLGPAVNSGGWESQPSFSIDGKTLYFVSDRSGGYGGMDIWMTRFENGRFTTPQNLGPNINTAEDETCPFIHFDDQTLYFASKGHLGMGGSDIYFSRRQADGSWGEAQNMGYPINTEADESGLVVDFFAQKAYMASNRLGGYGGMDIFSFDLPAKALPMSVASLNGTVTDAKTGKPVAADIQVLDLGNGISMQASGRVAANTSTDETDGRYSVTLVPMHDYAINVSAKGYLFYSDHYSLSYGFEDGIAREDLLIQKDIQLIPIEKGSSIRLENIFFDVASSNLIEMSYVELDKVVELLSKNPSLQVEIGGHTDDVGSDADNQKLSEARAKAVYDYLVAKGVAANRLTFKGYGESRPVADNKTEEGRRLNRRTELKVL